jgi:hypothetical protein
VFLRAGQSAQQPANVSSTEKQAEAKKAPPTKATHRLDIFLDGTRLDLDKTIFQIVPKPPQGTSTPCACREARLLLLQHRRWW